VLDPVDGDVVAEDGIDDLVQLVRVVDRCVKGQLLALGPFCLDIVLPEISLFFHARPTLFLVNLKIFVRVIIFCGIFLVLTVNVIQLARTETVEDVRNLVSNGGVAADGADGVHVRPRLPPVPDEVVQGQVLRRGGLGELGGKDGV